MSTLGKDAEHQIMQAIEKVAELVHDGKTPNDAIVKVASDYQLRPGYIKVLTHAFNTGSTTRQRESSDDLFDKAAEFELANLDNIMDRLFPKHVKTAAELRHDTVVSLDYGIDPSGLIDRHNKKLASLARCVEFKMCEKPPPLPASPDAALKKTARMIDRGRKDVDEARRLASSAFDKAAGVLFELREYFRQPGCLKFAYVREKAELLDGKQVAAACDQLLEAYPTLKKHAGVEPARLDMHATPFQLMRKLAASLQTYVRLHNEFELLEEKIGTAVEAVHRPFVHAPATSVLEEPSSTKRGSFVWNPFTQMILGGFTKDTLNGVAGKLGPPADDSLKNDAVSQLTDPSHEATLKNIRTQATVSDLMANDPVISGYPQHEVFSAFNDIANLSPRSVDQRAILQTMLRQRLAQGQLSNFELDQALGMEQKLKQREGGGAPIQSVI